MKNIERSRKEASVFSFLIAFLLLSGGLFAAEPAEVKPVKDLTLAADFIFLGTVEETDAANLSIVEPGARTAIVRVDEVLEASGTLDDFTGRQVTVFLSEVPSAGEQRVFFTKVQLLGESLGVQEVGRAAASTEDLVSQVRSAKSEILQEDLAARLAAADLVVSGRVLGTRATSAPESAPMTEHDPQWRRAELEVGSVLKGKVREKTVTFFYPGSFDVAWASVPKPSAGDEGTWLLHRQGSKSGAAVYFALDSQDLLTAAETKLAERLVKP